MFFCRCFLINRTQREALDDCDEQTPIRHFHLNENNRKAFTLNAMEIIFSSICGALRPQLVMMLDGFCYPWRAFVWPHYLSLRRQGHTAYW